MVLTTIDETPSLHIQTRFTPKSTSSRRHSHEPPSTRNVNPMPMPFSTRNIMNGGPVSTSSIVFSMNPRHNGEEKSHFFTTPMAKENGFSDIFRRWEDGSVKSQECDGTVKSYESRGSSKASRYSRNSQGSRATERKTRAGENHSSHRKTQSELILPGMDDWMSDKLNKYEKYTVKKMELTPPKVKPALDMKKVEVKRFDADKSQLKGYKDRNVRTVTEFEQQRDDDAFNRNVDESHTPWMKDANRTKPHRHENREPPPTHTNEQEETEYERTMRYYRAMGMNETLQKQVSSQSHEISNLHHRLEDMEQYYQSRLGDMSKKHREEIQSLQAESERELKDAKLDKERAEKLWNEEKERIETEWSSKNERMEREIFRLTDENRTATTEVRNLQVEKERTEALKSKLVNMEREILRLTDENRMATAEVRNLQVENERIEVQKSKLEKDIRMMQEVREVNHRLIDEVRGFKVEVDKVTNERDAMKGYLESLERDLDYHKKEREKVEETHQNRMAGILEERRREKEVHQSMITNLMKEHDKEKQSAFQEVREWKMRLQSLEEECEKEKDRALREVDELRMRLQSATRELEEERSKAKERAFHQENELNMRLEEERKHNEERVAHQENEWKARLQSLTRELEEEMTRNAAITKDKNSMADMMEDYISKMEEMHRHKRELEREKRELMMMNSELEAENMRVNVLTKEKHALGGAMDGYLAQVTELQKRNAELTKETMMLKAELIDVLEVASHYQ